MKSLFVTFEGGEGSGKSTLARLVHQWVQARGIEAVLTREPGGTPLAEQLRGFLLHHAHAISAAAQSLLFYAAREDHVRKVILPALQAGHMVLCDRFIDSTRAYQTAQDNGLNPLLDSLEQNIAAVCWPAITFLLDLDPVLGLERARQRGSADAFEARPLAFHQRLREIFLERAQNEPQRFCVLDARLDPQNLLALACERLEDI